MEHNGVETSSKVIYSFPAFGDPNKGRLLQGIRSTNAILHQSFPFSGVDGPKAKLSDTQNLPIYKSTERDINLKCAPFLVAPVFGNNINDATPRLQIILTYTNLNKDGTMGRLAVHLLVSLV